MGASISRPACLTGIKMAQRVRGQPSASQRVLLLSASVSEVGCARGIVCCLKMGQHVEEQPPCTPGSQRGLQRRSTARHKTHCGASEWKARKRTPSSMSVEDLPMAQRRPSRAKTSPPAVNLDDLPMLEAQASKLRATIERRTACAGASNKSDDVPSIVGHYVKVLGETEEQIARLKGAPAAKAAQQPAAEEPPLEAASLRAEGKKMTKRKKVSFKAEDALPGRPSSDSVSTACSSKGGQTVVDCVGEV